MLGKLIANIKNLTTILVLVLIGVIVFTQFRGCSPQPNTPTVIIKTDTVYKDVKVKVTEYKPKYVTRIQEKEVKIEVPAKIDTSAVVKDYYTKYKTVDTVSLPYPGNSKKNFGYGIITDITQRNMLAQRSIQWNYKIPVITKTVTVYPPPRNQVYFGVASGFNAVNFVDNVGMGVILKSKQDNIYEASFGLANTGGAISGYIGAGIFWKIRLKKQKLPPIKTEESFDNLK